MREKKGLLIDDGLLLVLDGLDARRILSSLVDVLAASTFGRLYRSSTAGSSSTLLCSSR